MAFCERRVISSPLMSYLYFPRSTIAAGFDVVTRTVTVCPESLESYPTIFSIDRNLPVEFYGLFNVVVDYNCDYTGWAVSSEKFNMYTVPLYINMVKALNPEAWCLITNISDQTFERAQQRETERFDLIKELLTKYVGKFVRTKRHMHAVFYGGSSLEL